MREILFRGKRMDNGEWVEAASILRTVDGAVRELYIAAKAGMDMALDADGNVHTMTAGPHVLYYRVDPDTVGQFTGLTDKNGKRAFEHDVIKHHFGDEIGVIRYGEYRNPFGDDSHGGHVGFYVDWVTGEAPGTLRKDLAYWMKIVEVIGSIHDNPELLNQ